MRDERLSNGDLIERASAARRCELERAARILHDDVGPTLTIAGLELDLLALDFAGQAPGLEERVAELRGKMSVAFESVRRLSYELTPDLVTRIGFPAALERLADGARREFAGTVECSVPSTVMLDPLQAAALYRIAECALENSLRHSGAALVRLSFYNEPETQLEIHDNGTGFDPAVVQPGFGLLLIRHLARKAGFDLRLTSAAGQGAMLSVTGNLGVRSHAD